MPNYKTLILFLAVCIGWFLPCTNAGAGVLVIGRVSDNPTKHYKELKPLLDYVVDHMKDLGITEGKVLLAKDKDEMIRYLKEGKVDWATKGAFQGILYAQEAGAEILLRSWRNGTPTYYTVFFARKDNGINSLRDLVGKKIAFEDPGSTSAYFVPVAILKKMGLHLQRLPSPRLKPSANKIGYVFARGELNIATWVHKGLADAGAFHNQDWENPENNPVAIRKDLKIFHRSRSLPRMVEVVRGDLDVKIKDRLKKILLNTYKDPAAKSAMKSYSKTTRFDEFKGEAKEELEEVEVMMKYIGKEVR